MPKARLTTIALVGDRNDSFTAHRAAPLSLTLAAAALEPPAGIDVLWIPTPRANDPDALQRCDGFWCVPGSPYESQRGALHAIRHARERGIPFLGTCGGFQHAVLEYALNVLEWHDAFHAEGRERKGRAVIAPLACSLIEVAGRIRLHTETHLARAYARTDIEEEYRCSYGVSAAFRAALTEGALREAAVDADGDLRAVELDGHPFFVATLFQPERAALRGAVPPIVGAFVTACAKRSSELNAEK